MADAARDRADDLLQWLAVMADGRIAVSLVEAAYMLDCSQDTIRRLIAADELESFRTRKQRKVLVHTIVAYVQRRVDDAITPEAFRRKLANLRNQQQRRRVRLAEDADD